MECLGSHVYQMHQSTEEKRGRRSTHSCLEQLLVACPVINNKRNHNRVLGFRAVTLKCYTALQQRN